MVFTLYITEPLPGGLTTEYLLLTEEYLLLLIVEYWLLLTVEYWWLLAVEDWALLSHVSSWSFLPSLNGKVSEIKHKCKINKWDSYKQV